MDCVFYNILGVLLKFNVCINYGVKCFLLAQFRKAYNAVGDFFFFVVLNALKEGFNILISKYQTNKHGVYVKIIPKVDDSA